MWRRVQQSERRVCHQPGVVLAECVVKPPQHVDPDLDVLPLRLTDLALRGRRKMGEIAVLLADQVGLAEREVQVKVDQAVERFPGVIGLCDDGRGARQQPGADAGNRATSVSQDWVFEKTLLRALPSESFDTALTLTPRVDRYAHLLTELIPAFRHVGAGLPRGRSYGRGRVRRLGRRPGSVGVGGSGGRSLAATGSKWEPYRLLDPQG